MLNWISRPKYQRITEIIKNLRSEIEGCENILKAYQENEGSLKNTIKNLKDELVEQEMKFAEVGNPDYDAIIKLEEVVNKKMEQVGKSLEDSLTKRFQENNKKIEEKLNWMIYESKPYAELAKQNPVSSSSEHCDGSIQQQIHAEGDSASSLPNNLTFSKVLQLPTKVKQIMQDAKNEEKVQEREQEWRAKKIIIHGAHEIGDNNDEIKVNDTGYITQILTKMGVVNKPESVTRLGKPNDTKKRTMKIVMKSKHDKEWVMANLNKLKNTEEQFDKIRVTDDYTIAEREQIKMWVEKAEKKSSSDTERVYRVRGDPKNGLRLVSFLRK